jgi:hypothetical protein
MLRLSILDQSPIYDNETALQAFQRTILLAQEAEKWGYHRFWVSEHMPIKLTVVMEGFKLDTAKMQLRPHCPPASFIKMCMSNKPTGLGF